MPKVVEQKNNYIPEGALDIDYALRANLKRAITEYIDTNGGDRYSLAAALSKATQQDISKNSLDTWTAPSRTDWRFPLNTLPAFIKITGANWLLQELAEKCDCVVISEEEMNSITLMKKKREHKKLTAEIAALEAVESDRLNKEAS